TGTPPVAIADGSTTDAILSGLAGHHAFPTATPDVARTFAIATDVPTGVATVTVTFTSTTATATGTVTYTIAGFKKVAATTAVDTDKLLFTTTPIVFDGSGHA
ncbi:MAG: hypothetical protein KAH25_12230, partial [Bacteroidales bacterium]|nr:hypothetical protein [Bacteroidales bacterium]